MNFQIKSDILPVVSAVGDEGTKVIVIDDFLNDIQSVRDFAYRLKNFQPDGVTAYPGLRAELPSEYTEAVLSAVKPLMFDIYDIPAQLNVRAVMKYYSLLSARASELDVVQRMPHFDSNKKHYYAVLHYLNEGEFGGTGFFRHKPTKFETISQERRDIYIQSVNTFLATRGLPEPQYINKDTNHFELFATIAYKPNRLVIYPGFLLHSGLVSETDVSDNPQLGRLTANVFVECQ